MARYTRAQWGARPAGGGVPMPTSGVQGIALHWPAMGTRRLLTVADVMAALRGWQNFHMDDRGWADIAYQEAIDQAGNVYVLRGFSTRSAANGNTDLNNRFGALLLILGEGEQPTGAMMKAAHRRIRAWRKQNPGANLIVGHGQIRPGGTGCPGPAVQARINAAQFDPPTRLPARIRKYLELTKGDLEVLKRARDNARARGEDMTQYRRSLRALRRSRRAARRVPRR